MTRWRTIPEMLAVTMRPWQMTYMIFFAAYSTVANLTLGPDRLQVAMSIFYLLLSFGSLVIVLPNLRRSLFRSNDPLRSHQFSGMPWKRTWWRLYLYIAVPIFFIAVLQLFSAISSAFLQFDQTNVSQKPTLDDYITPVLAGLEEIWRWSMIGTVVVVARLLLKRVWSRGYIREVVFAVAIFLSSLAFGSAHVLEFNSDRLRALILFSGLGLILAFMTILTGRILLVMAVHIGYDLWVTILSTASGSAAVGLTLLVYGALLVAPVVTVIWRHQIFTTEDRQKCS